MTGANRRSVRTHRQERGRTSNAVSASRSDYESRPRTPTIPFRSPGLLGDRKRAHLSGGIFPQRPARPAATTRSDAGQSLWQRSETHGTTAWRGSHQRRVLLYKYSVSHLVWINERVQPPTNFALTPRQAQLLAPPGDPHRFLHRFSVNLPRKRGGIQCSVPVHAKRSCTAHPLALLSAMATQWLIAVGPAARSYCPSNFE